MIKYLNSSSHRVLMSATAADTGSTWTASDDRPSARNRVGEIGAMIDANPEFGKHIGENVTAKGVLQFSTIQAMNDLADTFGEDELRTWPIIGTDEEKKDNNPEWYKVPFRSGGETKMRRTSFIDEITTHMSRGRDLQSIIDAVKDAKENAKNTAHPIISAMLRPEDRNAAKDDAQTELSVYRSTIRTGMKMWQQIWRFETLPLLTQGFFEETVMQPFYQDANGNEVGADVTGSIRLMRPVQAIDEVGQPIVQNGKPVWARRIKKTAKPVRIADASDSSAFIALSSGSFINLKIDDLRLAGGTLEALLAMRKRGGSDDEDGGHDEDNNVTVNNLATCESAMAGANNWFDQEVNVEAITKKFKAAIKSKKLDDVAAFAETIREMHIHTKALFDLSLTIISAHEEQKAAAEKNSAAA